MSFVLKAVADVTVDVSIHIPGEAEPSTLQATWKLHDWDEFQARLKAMQAGEIADEQLIEEDLLGLGNIKDEKGEDLPFDKELVQQLMKQTYIRRPLLASWLPAQNGRAATAAKN